MEDTLDLQAIMIDNEESFVEDNQQSDNGDLDDENGIKGQSNEKPVTIVINQGHLWQKTKICKQYQKTFSGKKQRKTCK